MNTIIYDSEHRVALLPREDDQGNPTLALFVMRAYQFNGKEFFYGTQFAPVYLEVNATAAEIKSQAGALLKRFHKARLTLSVE